MSAHPAQPELCIASKARGTVIDTLRPDGLTRIYGHTLEQVRAERGYEDAEIMPLDDFCAWKAQQQDSPISWEPTTRQRYDEALECLPPIDWTATGFLVGEPYDHHAVTGRPRFQAYRRVGERFEVSSRPITRQEWGVSARAFVLGLLYPEATP